MMDMDSPFPQSNLQLLTAGLVLSRVKKVFPLSGVKLPPTVMVDSLILYRDINSSPAHIKLFT